MTLDTTKELQKRFQEIEKERDPKRQVIIRAALIMRDAKNIAVEAQQFVIAADLRDRTLDLLRLLD